MAYIICLYVLFNLFSWGTVLNFIGFLYILVRIYSFLVSHGQLSVTVIQGDQKVSVHLMITIQKVISNVQCVPRQLPDVY
jgi:hypothetical protein